MVDSNAPFAVVPPGEAGTKPSASGGRGEDGGGPCVAMGSGDGGRLTGEGGASGTDGGNVYTAATDGYHQVTCSTETAQM